MASTRAAPASAAPAPGFTAVELLVVIVIVAVLASIAMPSFADFSVNQRLRTATYDLIADLTFARGEAVKRSNRVTIGRVGSSWAGGWSVIDNNGNTLARPPAARPFGRRNDRPGHRDVRSRRPPGRIDDRDHHVRRRVLENQHPGAQGHPRSERPAQILMKTLTRMSPAKGFSLLEVLVSMFVLALGLLGLAGLQTRVSVAEMESYQRTQALILVQDMVDRIATNGSALRADIDQRHEPRRLHDGAQFHRRGRRRAELHRQRRRARSLRMGQPDRRRQRKERQQPEHRHAHQRTRLHPPAGSRSDPYLYLVVVSWQGRIASKAPAIADRLRLRHRQRHRQLHRRQQAARGRAARAHRQAAPDR